MASIIVTPSEQKHFADKLKDRTKLLMQKQRQFLSMIHDASAICQDTKYAEFRRKVENAAQQLQSFKRNAERYSDFLYQKARAGERYLEGGR